MEWPSIIIGVLGILVSIVGIFLGYRFKFKRKHTWKQVLSGIKKFDNKIKEFNPDIVVGISDGIVVAGIIATNYDIDHCFLLDIHIKRDEKNSRQAEILGSYMSVKDKKILLVDNHLYSGFNLNSGLNYLLRKKAGDIKTLVIFKHEHENPYIIPDFVSYETNGKIQKVPWGFTDFHIRTYFS